MTDPTAEARAFAHRVLEAPCLHEGRVLAERTGWDCSRCVIGAIEAYAAKSAVDVEAVNDVRRRLNNGDVQQALQRVWTAHVGCSVYVKTLFRNLAIAIDSVAWALKAVTCDWERRSMMRERVILGHPVEYLFGHTTKVLAVYREAQNGDLEVVPQAEYTVHDVPDGVLLRFRCPQIDHGQRSMKIRASVL